MEDEDVIFTIMPCRVLQCISIHMYIRIFVCSSTVLILILLRANIILLCEKKKETLRLTDFITRKKNAHTCIDVVFVLSLSSKMLQKEVYLQNNILHHVLIYIKSYIIYLSLTIKCKMSFIPYFRPHRPLPPNLPPLPPLPRPDP